MSVSTQVLHTINQIVEELSPEECKRVSYLCGMLDIDRCAAKVRETLQATMVQVEIQNLFLMELMLRMKRYDLLRSVLGISKPDAEGLLKNGCALSEYRVLMAELNEDFGSGDLDSLIFLLRGTLPKEKLEKSECFLDVVVELERSEKISCTRMDEMECYLKAIHRLDLVKRLRQYRNKVGTPKQMFVPIKNTGEQQLCRNAASNSFSSGFCSMRKELSKPCAITSQPQSIHSRMSTERRDDVYRMQSNPRGVCLIIDCVGTEGVQLQQLFEGLRFRVILHMLLGVEDIISVLRSVSRQIEHYGADSFTCCIISRTDRSGLLGTDSAGAGLGLDVLRHFFTPDSCPGLTGKPKLFFIQGYELAQNSRYGDEAGELETDGASVSACRTDAAPTRALPTDADVFWSHCWTQEKHLEENGHRSLYLQSLRDSLLKAQRGGIHLVDAHMEVNRAIFNHSPKNPGLTYHLNLRHTLRKHVCLS